MDVQKLDQKLETLNRQAAVARCNAYQLRNSEARIAMQIDQAEVGSRNRVLAEQLKSAGVPVEVLSESETKQQYLAERPLYLVKKLLLPDFQGNIAVIDAEFAGEFELVAGQFCTLPAVVAVVERELHAQNVELRRLYAEKNKPETQTISTKVVVDVDSGAVLERESYQYAGPVAKCCGATSGQKTAAANELKVSNLLTTQFQKIFSDNSNILSTLTNALTPVVNKGPDQYGFDAAEDSALRTQATDTIAAGNRNATNALRSTLAAQGGGTGGMLPSGSAAALEGDLAEQEANKQSDAQLGITEKGYETGRQNFFTAEGELAGAPGALENPATAAGGAAEGAASGAMQGQTDIANANNAWMAPVGGMIGAIAGAAVPKIPGMGGKPGCWIAEAIYGVDDFRTHLVRAWLNTEFTKQRIGRIVMAFYLKFGQRIAKVVRKNRILKTMLQPLFDAALRRALKEKN